MDILTCECGSTEINYDLSTGKKSCAKCNSSNIELVEEYEFLKKLKRLEKKINVFGSIEEDDPDDEVRI